MFQTTYILQENPKGSRDSFKLLQKQNTRYPQYSFKLQTSKTNFIQGSSTFFQITSKIEHNEFPRFSQITSKTRQGILEILLNKLLQKQNLKGLRDSFKLGTSKKPRGPQEYIKIYTSKTKAKGPESLSNYFKNKTHREFPRLFQSTKLQKPDKRGA